MEAVIRFPLGGIPVEIRPSFWLVAVLIAPFPLSAALRPSLLPYLLVWVGVVAVSVLVHEAGHAFSARRLGATVSITLYAVGGYTAWEAPHPVGPWKRAGLAAAGSCVGLLLGAVAWLLGPRSLPPDPGLLTFGVVSFWQVNILWGVLNWLPVRPLDGGHMLLGVLEGLLGDRGRKIADVIFPLATLAGAVAAFAGGLVLLGIFALVLLAGEVREWRAPSPGAPPAPSPQAAAAGDGNGNEDL